MTSTAASSVSLKDVATTGVALAASLAALYSVLSLSIRLDLARPPPSHDNTLSPSRQRSRSGHRRRKSSVAPAPKADQSVGPDRMGAVPGDSTALFDDAPSSASFLLSEDQVPDALRLSQLDQPTLDSELARTDAKLRRLLKRKEKLELRRNQLSVAQLQSTAPLARETTPSSLLLADSHHPSITPSVVAGAAAGLLRPLTPEERVLFGIPATVPMPPSVEGTLEPRARRDSMTTHSTSTHDSVSTDSTGSGVPPNVPLGLSTMSSEHNELDAAAAATSSSSSSSSADPDAPVEDNDDVPQGEEEEEDDDDSDVLSSISDASAGLESVLSDTSLGSDFSFLSDARYGLFHQHG